jgi:hypothetical protein
MQNGEYSVAKSAKLALVTGYSPIQWVPRFFPRVKAALLNSILCVVKNEWNYTSVPLYAFMVSTGKAFLQGCSYAVLHLGRW